MKKFLSLFIVFAALAGVVFTACSSSSNSKSPANSSGTAMTLVVTPSVLAISTGASAPLTATLKNPDGTVVNTSSISWTSTAGGTFSQNPSSTTVFTAPTTPATGKITADASAAGGPKTSINVTVTGTQVNTLTFVLGSFTTEGGLNDISTWGGPAGAFKAANPWPQMPGYDGVTRGVFEITWESDWDGPTLTRGTNGPISATQYTKVVFYAKVPSGTGDIVARSLGNDNGGSTTFIEQGFSLTTTWQRCEILLPSDRNSVVGILCFVFAADRYTVQGKTAPTLPFTFDVDYVHFE